MLLLTLLCIFAFFACLVSYVIVLKPYLRIQSLKKKFEDQGYKVKLEKFTLVNQLIIKKIKKCQQSKSDGFDGLNFMKRDYQGYDVVLLNVFNKIVIIVCGLELLKSSFRQSEKLQKQSALINNFERFFGGGLAMQEGQKWRTKRKIYSEIFNYNILENIYYLIQESTEKTIGQLKEGQERNALKICQNVYFNAFVKAYFGSQFSQFSYKGMNYSQAIVKTFEKIFRQCFTMRNKIIGNNIIRKGYTEQDRQINQLMQVICSQTRKYMKQKHMEYQENKRSCDQSQKKSDSSIITKVFENEKFKGLQGEQKEKMIDALTGDMMIFFFAAIDTSASVTTALLHQLQKHPEIKQKLIKQIECIKGRDLNGQSLKQLKYMDAVIDQALRMYGPANVILTRQIKRQDISIGNVELFKGAILIVQSLTVHHDPQYYKKPHQFNPDRWMQPKDLNYDPFTFISFGGGKRNCIGQYLGKVEMKMALTKFLTKWDFQFLEEFSMGLPFVYCSTKNKFVLKQRV